MKSDFTIQFSTTLLVILLALLLPASGTAQVGTMTPVKGIAIYISFPDAPVQYNVARTDSLINGVAYQESGVTRTVRKYWRDETRRNLDLTYTVFYYTAPQPSTYYQNLPYNVSSQLVKDALESVGATNPGFNWGTLSRRPDNSLRSVLIITSNNKPSFTGAAHFFGWTLSNNVQVSRFCASFFKMPSQTDNYLFVTCHELGHHLFDFPDLYDTDHSSRGGVFYFSLMAGNSQDIEPVGAPFRVLQNWGYVVKPAPATNSTFTLRTDGDSVLCFKNPHDTSEFYTIEARKKTTVGNSRFPVSKGLLIWHSDEKVKTSNNDERRTRLYHYSHTVVQPDGLYQLEGPESNTIDSGDVFGPGRSFTHTSNPTSDWWDGTTSGIEVTNIQFAGSDQITFTVAYKSPIHQDHYPILARTPWQVIQSQTTPAVAASYGPEKAIDTAANTYYHIDNGNRPHDLAISLGGRYFVNELFYTPNDNYASPYEGRIMRFKLYVSDDSLNWGTPVADDTFFRCEQQQFYGFPGKLGKYVLLSSVYSYPMEHVPPTFDSRTSVRDLKLGGVDERTYLAIAAFEAKLGSGVVLRPNPAKEAVQIGGLYKGDRIEIRNSVGQLIWREVADTESVSISTLYYTPGMYLVTIRRTSGTYSTYRLEILK